MNTVLTQPEPSVQKVQPVKSTRSNPNYTVWFATMSLFLLLLLALNIVQFLFTYQQNQNAAQRADTYQQRIQEAKELVQKQQSVILGLVDNYQKDAYNNPKVERIAEQQLIVSEYTLSALQIIALQNSQIIELLANAP